MTVFEVYDENGKYVGYFLESEEGLANLWAYEHNGTYKKVKDK